MGDGGRGTEAGLHASDDRVGVDSRGLGGDAVETGAIGFAAGEGEGDGESFSAFAFSTLASAGSSGAAVCAALVLAALAAAAAADPFFKLSDDAALIPKIRFEETLFRLNFCANIRA